MDTKSTGDITEQAVCLQALRQGWSVLRPIGDRMPYDMVFDTGRGLVKVQCKSAWKVQGKTVYTVDTRRTKTNRRQMRRERYLQGDCDFIVVYAQESSQFWVMPLEFFNNFKSGVTLRVDEGQRRLPSSDFKDAWNLIENFHKSIEI